MFAAADPGERFFGYFLVATRKYLAFGCENPIKITAGRRPNKFGSPKRARSRHGGCTPRYWLMAWGDSVVTYRGEDRLLTGSGNHA